MGSLKKFATWLSTSGKKNDKHETSPIIKIKIFNKRLARQVMKMDIQEKAAKKKAIEARQRGDVNGSKLHMKTSLQYRKWSNATESFRVRMEGVQYKLEQAKAMEQFAGVAQDIAGTLQGLQDTVKAPEISKLLSQMDLGFENMDSIMEQTTESLEVSEDASATSVSEEEVENALAEIDTELSLESGESLPSAPIGIDMQGQTSIDDLEDEINKLKAQRGRN